MGDLAVTTGRQSRLRKPEPAPPAPPKPKVTQLLLVRAYKAIADEVEGEIEVKAVNSDGTTVDPAITAKVLP